MNSARPSAGAAAGDIAQQARGESRAAGPADGEGMGCRNVEKCRRINRRRHFQKARAARRATAEAHQEPSPECLEHFKNIIRGRGGDRHADDWRDVSVASKRKFSSRSIRQDPTCSAGG